MSNANDHVYLYKLEVGGNVTTDIIFQVNSSFIK